MTGRKGVERVSPQRLRDARERAGLTQAQLARLLEYRSGQGPVGLWERGDRRPDAPTLARIARALQVDVVDLLQPGTPVTVEILRIAAGRTQDQTAAALGVSRTWWALLENGERPLVDGEAKAVADVLGCTPEQVEAAAHRSPR